MLIKRSIYMNIGIDIGGSHVGVGLVGSGGKIINKKEVDITEKM